MNESNVLQKASQFGRYLFSVPHLVDLVQEGGVEKMVLVDNSEFVYVSIFAPLLRLCHEIRLIGSGWNGDFSRSLFLREAEELDSCVASDGNQSRIHCGFEGGVLMPFFFGCLRGFNSWVPVMVFENRDRDFVWDVLKHLESLGFPLLFKGPRYSKAERLARKMASIGQLAVILDGDTLVNYFPVDSAGPFVRRVLMSK